MSTTVLQAEQNTMLHECLISIGSNIEPERHFAQAFTLLGCECELVAHSKPICTPPVGFLNQPDFLNAALLVRTPLAHDAFRAYLKAVENRLGRVRGPNKSGPRTMDLDIVAWNGELLDEGYFEYDYIRLPVNEVLAVTGRSLVERKN
ncbi:2-amino-4-hydroxy-6-hydroxymethyldihydropteridine diphosphokinase [Vreelandella populi]|uniref:2-amino-4-hydroxy-6-hydroxymethyldihydropteridine pyrophosphokinase n=1 Tax=Vreelandella populi TaxID=2498858 RepID=A0A3S1E8X1_9GAMM|nr:2-amino-4-hydroxy-6-hydroxymethyldihydropteridine diphosphokinase [Halomonas populi]RUR35507.1 2-amino-4-hydroxy-6-hydroxymethyldihydropteridine diphosphokinase [Halomonas populi]RUR47697.1 2-amino-4-hydroxy-6-hydroxymethyldihydropteridine diphosphokinase [Halomonas populi]RUR54440.1 2-amino-4-hydroxy-6-hydroxymethyldihydropteridine diphosphokinase [Halomonas populi]